jgi:hypothetical protein
MQFRHPVQTRRERHSLKERRRHTAEEASIGHPRLQSGSHLRRSGWRTEHPDAVEGPYQVPPAQTPFADAVACCGERRERTTTEGVRDRLPGRHPSNVHHLKFRALPFSTPTAPPPGEGS